MPITIETMKRKCQQFKEQEGRASFYDAALSIVEDHPLQASIVILATWNNARFRYFMKYAENLADLALALDEFLPLFKDLADKDIRTANFDEIGETVKKIYSRFSGIMGVEYTGTSKVMHLLNRRLFVMWDDTIRDRYGIVNISSSGYLSFLKSVQEKFKDIVWDDPDKTFAKAIDEYNFVTYTIPELRRRKEKEERKKAEKREAEQKERRIQSRAPSIA